MHKRSRHRAARVGTLALWMVVVLVPAPAHAVDPLLMFLIGFAKNLIESAIEERRNQAPAPSYPSYSPAPLAVSIPAPVVMKPGASMNEAELRALVDESFLHLTRAQREELLAGLDKALADPANTAHRATILTQFVTVARQFQFTHGQLNRLSHEEKREVAARFAANYRNMSPAQQQGLLEQLRLRTLPLPEDLNDLMLAALSTER